MIADKSLGNPGDVCIGSLAGRLQLVTNDQQTRPNDGIELAPTDMEGETVSMRITNRAGLGSVALESTLLAHGVPRGQGLGLGKELALIVTQAGARPAIVGVVDGEPIVGLTDAELEKLLAAEQVHKANTANLGVLVHQKACAATTVSTTMELASRAGVRCFATGGIGGVHPGLGKRWDVSADLMALARFPVAVFTSGVKSILDVASTREMLESLGVPVVGFGTDRFPAFYRRDGGEQVDARFDDVDDLAAFLNNELARTARGIVVANPIAEEDEVNEDEWQGWLATARQRADENGVTGRRVTPFLLDQLHRVSGGKTLEANLALIRSNARLAGQVCGAMTRTI